ncbi:MAG TPA: hypothetical protein VJ714_08710, partial [Anaerolineae bacterium]|nr:hypothetical protein [Anaerolineae bacterium]
INRGAAHGWNEHKYDLSLSPDPTMIISEGREKDNTGMQAARSSLIGEAASTAASCWMGIEGGHQLISNFSNQPQSRLQLGP